MNPRPQPRKLLPAICVGMLLTLTLVLVLPALTGDTPAVRLPTSAPGAGEKPFVSQGGNTATACDDTATCTTGALTNVGAGDTLVVIVTEYTTSAGAPSTVEEVTTGGDNGLTLLGSTPCIAGSGHGVTAIYGLADVAAQASVTFTVTYPAAEYFTIHALDVQGAAASPFETAGTGVCSTAAGTTGTATVTTTVPDDLVILGVEVRASTALAASGGDNLVNDASTTGAELDSGAMLDEIDPTTGSISLSATFSSASWSAIAVALKTAPLVSGTVSPSTSSLDAGQTIELTSTDATGGTPPITYQWYAATSNTTCSSGSEIDGATGLTYSPPALTEGTYFYCVWATDSSTPTEQVVYSNVAFIAVNPPLSVAITPVAPSIDSGQAVSLTANPTGGTGADSFAWFLGDSCSGATLGIAQAYTTPDLSADTTYCVTATDSSSVPATANATDTVVVSGSSLAVTITPVDPSIESGQTATLTSHPTGGTGAYSYAWYSGDACSGAVLGTAQAFTTPALTADATYCVGVTDSSYEPVTATATDTVSVVATPLSVTITPDAPLIDTGQTVELTAVPSGGVGADSYAWYSGNTCGGTALATTKVYTTPALTVTTEYCVAATDSASTPATATATAIVTVSSAALSVTITPTAPSVDSGNTIQLTAHASGGTGADTYAWYSGASCSGTVLASTQVLTTPALTSATSFCVEATDSALTPATATATATVKVTSGSIPATTPPSYLFPVVGAVVAALVALLLLALVTRRGRRMTFTQSGLPPETEWSLSFAGMAQRSAGPSITFSAKKGTHAFTIQEVAGYAAAPASGTVEVGKDPATVKVTFTVRTSEAHPVDADASSPSASTGPIADLSPSSPSDSGTASE